MIIDGRVKVKSGLQIAEFKETGVKYSDGSEQDVDAVIFAYVLESPCMFAVLIWRRFRFNRTGFQNTKPSMEKILGKDIIGKTKPVWGLDEEGEINGSYRPSGHPGVSKLRMFSTA